MGGERRSSDGWRSAVERGRGRRVRPKARPAPNSSPSPKPRAVRVRGPSRSSPNGRPSRASSTRLPGNRPTTASRLAAPRRPPAADTPAAASAHARAVAATVPARARPRGAARPPVTRRVVRPKPRPAAAPRTSPSRPPPSASPSRPKSASSSPATTRCATAPTRAPPAAPSETRAAVRRGAHERLGRGEPAADAGRAHAGHERADEGERAEERRVAALPPSAAIARPPSRPASAPAAAPPADAEAQRDPARRDARLRRRPARADQAAGPAGGARSGTLPAPATSHRLSRRWAQARAWPGARSRRRRASAVSSVCSSSAASRRASSSSAGVEEPRQRLGQRVVRLEGRRGLDGRPARPGNRRLTVVRFLGDRAHELVPVPRDRPDEDALPVLAERAPQRPDRLGESAVGDHHVRPHAIEDLLPVQGHRALLDEQQQQVEVARDERHLPPRPEERAAGGRERELREAVARRGHPPPAQPSFGGRSVIGPIHSSIRSMSWWSW